MNLDRKIELVVEAANRIDKDKFRISYFAMNGMLGLAVQPKQGDGIITSINWSCDFIENTPIDDLNEKMRFELKSGIESNYESFMRESRYTQTSARSREFRRVEPVSTYFDELSRQIDDDSFYHGHAGAMALAGLDDKDFEFW